MVTRHSFSITDLAALAREFAGQSREATRRLRDPETEEACNAIHEGGSR